MWNCVGFTYTWPYKDYTISYIILRAHVQTCIYMCTYLCVGNSWLMRESMTHWQRLWVSAVCRRTPAVALLNHQLRASVPPEPLQRLRRLRRAAQVRAYQSSREPHVHWRHQSLTSTPSRWGESLPIIMWTTRSLTPPDAPSATVACYCVVCHRKFSSLTKEDHQVLFFGIEPILSLSSMILQKVRQVAVHRPPGVYCARTCCHENAQSSCQSL